MHRAETIHYLRPALKPLLYDRAFINGELRYRQVPIRADETDLFRASSVLVYEKSDYSQPLESHKVTATDGRGCIAPCWSPDGKQLAIISRRGGNFELWVVTNVEFYKNRLTNPVDIRIVQPLP